MHRDCADEAHSHAGGNPPAGAKVWSMRWFWIDRFVAFESGKTASAVKNVSLSEEHLHDHFPGFPVMPASLMLEGMAQTGGILLSEAHRFEYLVFLAKVPKFKTHLLARPGDQLTYRAELLDSRPEGGMTQVTAHRKTNSGANELVAEAEIVFANLTIDDPGLGLDADAARRVQQGLTEMLLQSGVPLAATA